jgi:hypothetical protein
MDKKNVQNRTRRNLFVKKPRGLYNKWAEGLKEGREEAMAGIAI